MISGVLFCLRFMLGGFLIQEDAPLIEFEDILPELANSEVVLN